MLANRLIWRHNIKPTLAQCLVFARLSSLIDKTDPANAMALVMWRITMIVDILSFEGEIHGGGNKSVATFDQSR